jgi:hypothetical protein
MNADFNRHFFEICGGIPAAEKSQNLVAAGAEGRSAWLIPVEAAEDGEVEEPANFVPQRSLLRKRKSFPSPVETTVEFMFHVAAKHAEV